MCRLTLALVALVTGGCLGEPEQQDWQGLAFPPSAQSVNMRTGVVADLDGDGYDDIILANETGDPATQGFFVLLGRDAANGTVYDVFVNTPDVQPLALLAANLGGTAQLDIVIYGEADGRGRLVVYPDATPSSFGSPLIATMSAAQLPPAGGDETAFIWLGDADHFLGDTDVVFGHARGMFLGGVYMWDDDFRLNELWTLAKPGVSWVDANVAGARLVGERPTQDLLVLQRGQVSWYENDADASFTSAMHHTSVPSPGLRYVAYADLDGDGRDDIYNVSNGIVSAYVSGPGAVDGAHYLMGADGTTGENDDGYLDGVATTSVNEDPTPDLVIMDRASGPQTTSFIKLYVDVSINGGSLVVREEHVQLLDDFQPVLMVTGDFDGDAATEVVVFDRQGKSRCFELKATAIVPC